MKAFLLAAGHGTRLRPLTDEIPKCLLPIRGTPILEIWLQLCGKFGIDEVLVNVHSHAPLVREATGSRSGPPKVRVVEEKVLLGSAGTLSQNRSWVEAEDCFWVLYADVLTVSDLRPMLEMHRTRKPVLTMGVYEVPDPSRCGIVEMAEDGTIADFVEKPAHASSNLAFSGVLLGSHGLLDLLPKRYPADLGFDVFPRIKSGMIGYRMTDYLIDIGTVDNYKQAQLDWPGLEGTPTDAHASRPCI